MPRRPHGGRHPSRLRLACQRSIPDIAGGTLISIVLAVFNDAPYVADAIDRVLGQVGVEIELVLVDDGSSDESPQIARAAADRDSRVRLIASSQRRGRTRPRAWRPGGDRRLGLVRRLRRPLGARLGRRLAMAVTGSPDADVVVAGARYTFESGRAPDRLDPPDGPPVPGSEAFRLLLSGRITGHLWNKLFRRELLLQTPFTPARVQSDLALVAQALAGAAQASFLPVHVYDYRVRSGSIITSRPSRAESLELLAGAVAARGRPVGAPRRRHRRIPLLRHSVSDAVRNEGRRAGAVQLHGARTASMRRRLRSRLRHPELVLLARRRDLRVTGPGVGEVSAAGLPETARRFDALAGWRGRRYRISPAVSAKGPIQTHSKGWPHRAGGVRQPGRVSASSVDESENEDARSPR